jgi:hypothetical protein
MRRPKPQASSSAVETLASMSSSYDRKPRVHLFVVRHLLVDVEVLFSAEVCGSTTGEYIRTQQALTIGWK